MATHKTESPKSTIATRIAQVLKSRKYRRENRSVVAVLALAIVIGVAVVLMQRGLAKKYTVRVLDCHYIGNVAHTHNQDCYDDSGNLICPLRERELHVHDESCFDDQGNLICGKDELVEEHVHGDGCFLTVASFSEEEPVKAVTNGEQARPEQVFVHTFENSDGDAVVSIEAHASEGAFPKGTTMEATWVGAAKLDKGLVQKAIAAKTGGKLLDQQSFDISFYDAQHNEVQPASPVTIVLTSQMLADTSEKAQVVHIESDAEAKARANASGETEYQAEGRVVDTLNEQALAKQGIELADDQVAFTADQFSTYVLALATSDVEWSSAGAIDGATLRVSASAAAGIPQNATYNVVFDDERSDSASAMVSATMQEIDPEGKVNKAIVLHLEIKNAQGELVSLDEPANVSIELKDPSAYQGTVFFRSILRQDGSDIAGNYDSESGTVSFQIDDATSDTLVLFADTDKTPDAPQEESDTAEPVDTDDSNADADAEVIQVAVPDVRGLSYKDAKNELAEIGLTATRNDVASSQQKGTVVEQEPYPGDLVEEGAVISLARSNGLYAAKGGLRATTLADDEMQINVEKLWEDEDGNELDTSPADVVINIHRLVSTDNGNTWTYDSQYGDSLTIPEGSDTTQRYASPVLKKYEGNTLYSYFVSEDAVPDGYDAYFLDAAGDEHVRYNCDDSVPINQLRDLAQGDTYRQAIINKPREMRNISLTGRKTWQVKNGDNTIEETAQAPEGASATFEVRRLVSSDKGATYTPDTSYSGPTHEMSGSHHFENLPLFSTDWTKRYKYYIVETPISDGYKPNYFDRSGAAISDPKNAATDKTSTLKVRNDELNFVDVPVIKEWGDFIGSEYDWSVEVVLEKAYFDETTKVMISDYEAIEPRVTGTLTKNGTLTFNHLPQFAVLPETLQEVRVAYSVSELSYEVKQNGTTVASWDGTTDNPDYAPVFIQDAGDPETETAVEDWYQIIMSNERHDLGDPLDNVKLSLDKTWQGGTGERARFELVRWRQEFYRDWSDIPDPDMNQATWKPAVLNFNNKEIKTEPIPNGAEVYAVVRFKDSASSSATVIISGEGPAASATVSNATGPVVWSSGFKPGVSGGPQGDSRNLAISGNTDQVDSIHLVLFSSTGNTPREDIVASIDTMEPDNPSASNAWHLNIHDALDGDYDNDFDHPLIVPATESDDHRHQTYYSYSYYFKELDATPVSEASFANASGATVDESNRIDFTTPRDSDGRVTTVATNEIVPELTVSKKWIDVQDTSGYPTVLFTLKYWLEGDSGNRRTYTDPRVPEGFEDIRLGFVGADNNYGTWKCPVKLPSHIDGKLVHYYVEEKRNGSNAVTEPSFNGYDAKCNGVWAYPAADQGHYEKYDSPHQADITATSGGGAVAGSWQLRNEAPRHSEMDMVKKKWIYYLPDGSLKSDPGANMNSCYIKYKIMRRAIDERIAGTRGDYDPTYTGPEIVQNWETWYKDIVQGFNADGSPYNSVDPNDFTYWVNAGGEWHFNLHYDNSETSGLGGGGIEYKGYRVDRRENSSTYGQIVPVRYQYVFIEIGCYRDPACTIPFDNNYDYYAVVPATWDGNGSEIEIFPKIISQDQDRITNVISSNMRLNKDWGDEDDDTDIQEIYVKLYRTVVSGGSYTDKDCICNFTKGGKPVQDVVNFSVYDVASLTLDSRAGLLEDRDRYVNLGTESNPDWYIRMYKNEADVELRRLAITYSDQNTGKMSYWAKEVAYKDAGGNIVQVYNNLNQANEEFNPNSKVRPYYYNSTNGTRVYDPYDASFLLQERNKNIFTVDNTPDRKTIVQKKWYDEAGEETAAWDRSVKYKIQRQAQRYVNLSDDLSNPDYVAVGKPGVWGNNSGGGSTTGWSPEEHYPADSDFYYNDTSKLWKSNTWEDVIFDHGGGSPSPTLSIEEAEKTYKVFYPHTGGNTYTVLSEAAPSANDPKPSDGSDKWYDVIDGLQNSYWETYRDNGDETKPGFMYKYFYRVIEQEPSGDAGEAYSGTTVTMEPSNGVLDNTIGRESTRNGDTTEVKIRNEKSSVKLYKEWLKPDGTATDPNAPIEPTTDKVRLKVVQIIQNWTKHGTGWLKDGDPTTRDLKFVDSAGNPLTPANRLEIVQQNKIIEVQRNTSDTTGATYKIVDTADQSSAIAGHDNWSLCIGGLDMEHQDSPNAQDKVTYTYLFVEDKDPADGTSAEQTLSSVMKSYKTTYDSSLGLTPFDDYADPDHKTQLAEFYKNIVEHDEGALASIGGTAGIKNKKISFNVVKKWLDANGQELASPWDSTLTQVDYTIKQVVQKQKMNASGQWENDGDATKRDITLAGVTNNTLNIVEDNQIITCVADPTDATKFTVTCATAASTEIAGRTKWADRIDGLPIESETYEDAGITYRDVYTYEIVEKNIPNAITAYTRVDTQQTAQQDQNVVSDGETMVISNKTTSLTVIKKWFNPDGTPTTDNQPWDADPAIDNVTFSLKQSVQKWNWDDSQSKWVKDGDPTERDITISDPNNVGLTEMRILKTNKYVYVKPTNAARDAYEVGIYENVTSDNGKIDGNDNWALRINGLDHEKIDGNKRETYSYKIEEATIANTITTYDPDTATVEQGGSVTINNRKNPLEITVEKEFTGLAAADILDNGALKDPFRSIKLTLTNKNTLNKLPSGVDAKVFDTTIGDLLDAGILTLDPGTGGTPTVKVSTTLKPDTRFFVRDDTNGTFYKKTDGTYTDVAPTAGDADYEDDTGATKYRETTSMLNLDALIDGEEYELAESDYTLAGFQRDSSAATSVSGTPDGDGKLTLPLENPYKKIKITIEKSFQGIDDLFDGVTNAKIKSATDYASLSADVKKLLEGITLTLKNKTANNATVISGTIKDLIQSGAIEFDGSAFKVSGEITKDTPGVTVDALTEGAEYELTETGQDAATAIPTGFILKTESVTSKSGTLDGNATLSVACKNIYEPFIDIKIYKVSENEAGTGPDQSGTPLEGATFTLEKGEFVTDDTDPAHPVTTWEREATFNVPVTETSTKGIFEAAGLKEGTYKLVEHDVPDGYIKYDFDTIFRVSYDSAQHKLVVQEVTTDPVTGKDIAKASEVVVDTASNEVRLYVANPPGEELPHSGGPGTLPMTLAGIALLASASLYLLKAHRKVGLNLHKIG